MGELVKVDPVETAALSQIVAAEVDMQVATAKRYPRDLKAVLINAASMATRTKDIAASCCYDIPRGGKSIRGPSVRLAEIFASCWGNLRAEIRTLGADDKHVEGQAMVWDLESNVAVRKEVKRKITGKGGRRFNDDMIATTGLAAASIAFREAVFKVVPKAYIEEAYRKCQDVAMGDISTLMQDRTNAFEYFRRFGITEDRILAVLEKPNIEAVTIEDIGRLRAIKTAITSREIRPDEAFPEIRKDEAKGAEGLKQRIAQNQERQGAYQTAGERGLGNEPEDAPPPPDADAGLGPDEDIPF
jgi:hypothetical protein